MKERKSRAESLVGPRHTVEPVISSELVVDLFIFSKLESGTHVSRFLMFGIEEKPL